MWWVGQDRKNVLSRNFLTSGHGHNPAKKAEKTRFFANLRAGDRFACATGAKIELRAMALRILFAGSGEFGARSLDALLAAGHEIAQVITQPDRPAGRGRELSPTAIAKLAEKRGISVLK